MANVLEAAQVTVRCANQGRYFYVPAKCELPPRLMTPSGCDGCHPSIDVKPAEPPLRGA